MYMYIVYIRIGQTNVMHAHVSTAVNVHMDPLLEWSVMYSTGKKVVNGTNAEFLNLHGCETRNTYMYCTCIKVFKVRPH